jgi:hypothetical protein
MLQMQQQQLVTSHLRLKQQAALPALLQQLAVRPSWLQLQQHQVASYSQQQQQDQPSSRCCSSSSSLIS